jgi:hypothetical protein
MRPGRRFLRLAGLAALLLVNLPASPARAAVTVDGSG